MNPYLQSLQLLYFKNYEELHLSFSPHINCLVGENGSGKTNILDAVYYLSLTKSAFQKLDQLNVKHEEQYFMISGTFGQQATAPQAVKCSYSHTDKKKFLLNQVPYERLSEHIGQFPVVLIAPDDTLVIREGSEERRKFFDGIISQTDSAYLHNLLEYNHYLLQRNSLLKQFADRHYFDRDLLDTYSEPLLRLGKQLYAKRQSFTDMFVPLFEKHYAALTEGREKVGLLYKSHWQSAEPEVEFREAIAKDAALQRTTQGIHRDDYLFEIEELPLKKYGSQGQQKSYLIALKLAQFEAMVASTGRKPILLLDDIFDKLDDRRIIKMLQMIAAGVFGQIFMTDARPERSRQLLADIKTDIYFFDVCDGNAHAVSK